MKKNKTKQNKTSTRSSFRLCRQSRPLSIRTREKKPSADRAATATKRTRRTDDTTSRTAGRSYAVHEHNERVSRPHAGRRGRRVRFGAARSVVNGGEGAARRAADGSGSRRRRRRRRGYGMVRFPLYPAQPPSRPPPPRRVTRADYSRTLELGCGACDRNRARTSAFVQCKKPKFL